MTKGAMTNALAARLSVFANVIRWWGIGGSYAHKPTDTDLRREKDFDVLIWLTDKHQSDTILKKLAELSLQCGVLIHPVILLDENKERIQNIEMYEAMIRSAEKVFEHQ